MKTYRVICVTCNVLAMELFRGSARKTVFYGAQDEDFLNSDMEETYLLSF